MTSLAPHVWNPLLIFWLTGCPTAALSPLRSSFLSSRTQESSPAAAEFISCLSLRLAGALLLACIPGFVSAQQEFFLKNGDTVVFYGDSITARRIYSSFTEASSAYQKLAVLPFFGVFRH